MLWTIVVLLALPLGWLLFVAGRHRFDFQPPAPLADETRGNARRETLTFTAKDWTPLEAWLITPNSTSHPPLVIMAPGLCGTKEGPLETFAWAFAQSGFAVLMLDFRTFGASAGMPRHHVNTLWQVEDYQSAIAQARETLAARIDAASIILWGTSFSGAAAISAAARESVSGVIAHIPYLGGVPVHAPTRLQIARYIALSIAEMIGDALTAPFAIKLAPVYIAAYGKPGEHTFAMSRDNPSKHEAKGTHPFWSTMPDPLRGGWQNKMLVRSLRTLDAVSPRDDLKRLTCPVLLIGAMRDDLIAFDNLRAAASELPAGGSQFIQFDCGHFDPYVPPVFEPDLAAQLSFLRSTTAQ